jgi:hypothetical protein
LAIARTSKGARHAYRDIWPQLIQDIKFKSDAGKKNQMWWFMSQFLAKALDYGTVDFVLFMNDTSRFIITNKGKEIMYNQMYIRKMPLEAIIQQWESRLDLPNFIYQTFVHGYCFKKTADDPNSICSMCPSQATFTCIQTDDNFCDYHSEKNGGI